jgi:hypothetical protein
MSDRTRVREDESASDVPDENGGVKIRMGGRLTIVGQGPSIFQLLSGENQPLLITR